MQSLHNVRSTFQSNKVRLPLVSNVTAKHEVHRSSLFCCSIWRILVNFEKQHNFSVNLLVAAAVSSFLNRKSSISLKILCVKMKVFFLFSMQRVPKSFLVVPSVAFLIEQHFLVIVYDDGTRTLPNRKEVLRGKLVKQMTDSFLVKHEQI